MLLIGKSENIGNVGLFCSSIAGCFYFLYIDDLLFESHILLSYIVFFFFFPHSSKSKNPQGTGERRLSLMRKLVGRILGFRCQLEA